MVFIFGHFIGRRASAERRIISQAQFDNGDVRVGDLLEFVGGCPRFPGDECDLVGGYKSVIVDFKGELYYRIVS